MRRLWLTIFSDPFSRNRHWLLILWLKHHTAPVFVSWLSSSTNNCWKSHIKSFRQNTAHVPDCSTILLPTASQHSAKQFLKFTSSFKTPQSNCFFLGECERLIVDQASKYMRQRSIYNILSAVKRCEWLDRSNCWFSIGMGTPSGLNDC